MGCDGGAGLSEEEGGGVEVTLVVMRRVVGLLVMSRMTKSIPATKRTRIEGESFRRGFDRERSTGCAAVPPRVLSRIFRVDREGGGRSRGG